VITKKCTVCAKNCLKCNDRDSCEKCRDETIFDSVKKVCPCTEKKILFDGECTPCPKHCTTCTTPTQCTTCSNPYLLVKGECSQPCKKGFLFDESMKTCISCMKNCERCGAFDECEKCVEGFVYDGGRHNCVREEG